MSNIFADNTEVVGPSDFNDGLADFSDAAAGCEDINSGIQTIKCTLRDLPSFVADIANQKGFRLVTKPTVDNGSDIDVDDVTVFESVLVWNAMTNDFVNARAATFRKSSVVQRCGNVTVAGRVGMNKLIDFSRGNASLNLWTDMI